MQVNKSALYAILAEVTVVKVWFEKNLGESVTTETVEPMHPRADSYLYKYNGKDVKAGDLVIVPTKSMSDSTSNIMAARVLEVLGAEALEMEGTINYKWAFGKLDIDAYKATLSDETIVLQQYETRQRQSIRQQLISNLDLGDLVNQIKSPALAAPKTISEAAEEAAEEALRKTGAL